jgi:hypothetical protein
VGEGEGELVDPSDEDDSHHFESPADGGVDANGGANGGAGKKRRSKKGKAGIAAFRLFVDPRPAGGGVCCVGDGVLLLFVTCC